jgi:hypothetical protein
MAPECTCCIDAPIKTAASSSPILQSTTVV